METESTEPSNNGGARAGSGAPKGNANAQKHGLNTLKTAVLKLGSRAIDGRYRVGRQLQKWRRELVADLGGQDVISTQQTVLVDIAVKEKLILDSIDAYMLTQDTLINKRKKALLPIVLQCQQLEDSLVRTLTQLGIQRRPNDLREAARKRWTHAQEQQERASKVVAMNRGRGA
jgi:hypothetical protein